MIFLSYWFLIFACIMLPAYCLLPFPRLRMWLLLVSCVVFHTHFAGPAGVIPIVILGLLTYFTALSRNRRLCELAIALCVLALVFYKYTRFICESIVGAVSAQFGALALQQVGPLLPLVPPLAISFFTFEFVHYLYEIRRGEEPIKSPLEFSLFAIFWPSIVSGPIKRYQQFIPSLHEGVRKVGQTDVAVGLARVAWGLVQKFTADNIRNYTTSVAFGLPMEDTFGRWFFLFMHSARIYFDFAGYTDIAIGYARIMGISLPENFNRPYCARNMVEFWHRWHISLSTWIRDYIYIPLGGSRYGAVRRAINALIAFVLCGLWHGAAWNFAVWGVYHGVGVVVAASYARLPFGRTWQNFVAGDRLTGMIWHAASVAMTFIYVSLGWILFFYPLDKAWEIIVWLFTWRERI